MTNIILGLILLILVALVFKFFVDCKTKETEIREHRETIRTQGKLINGLNTELVAYKETNGEQSDFIDEQVIKVKSQAKSIMNLAKINSIHKTALKKISEKQYTDYVIIKKPLIPYATFVAPYKIASDALKEAQS